MNNPGTSAEDNAMMQEMIECPICYNIYDKPVQMNCGHTLCTPCLTRLVDQTRTNPEQNDDNPPQMRPRVNMAIIDADGQVILGGAHGLGGVGDQFEEFIDIPQMGRDPNALRNQIGFERNGTYVKCPECRQRSFIPAGGLRVNFRMQQMVQQMTPMYKERSLVKYCTQCTEPYPQGVAYNCTTCGEPGKSICSTCAIRFHNGHDVKEKALLTAKDVREMKTKMEDLSQVAFQSIEELTPLVEAIGGPVKDKIMQTLNGTVKIFNKIINNFESQVNGDSTVESLMINVTTAQEVADVYKNSVENVQKELIEKVEQAVNNFLEPFEKIRGQLAPASDNQEGTPPPVPAVVVAAANQPAEMERVAMDVIQQVAQAVAGPPGIVRRQLNAQPAAAHQINVNRQRQRQRIIGAQHQQMQVIQQQMHQQMIQHQQHQQQQFQQQIHQQQQQQQQQQRFHMQHIHHQHPQQQQQNIQNPNQMWRGGMAMGPPRHGPQQMQQPPRMIQNGPHDGMPPPQQHHGQPQFGGPNFHGIPPQHHGGHPGGQGAQQNHPHNFHPRMHQQQMVPPGIQMPMNQPQNFPPMNMPPQPYQMGPQMVMQHGPPQQAMHFPQQQHQQQNMRHQNDGVPQEQQPRFQVQGHPNMVQNPPMMPQQRMQHVQMIPAAHGAPPAMPGPHINQGWREQIQEANGGADDQEEEQQQEDFAFNVEPEIQDDQEAAPEEEEQREIIDPVGRVDPGIEAFRAANNNIRQYQDMRERMQIDGALHVEEIADEEDMIPPVMRRAENDVENGPLEILENEEANAEVFENNQEPEFAQFEEMRQEVNAIVGGEFNEVPQQQEAIIPLEAQAVAIIENIDVVAQPEASGQENVVEDDEVIVVQAEDALEEPPRQRRERNSPNNAIGTRRATRNTRSSTRNSANVEDSEAPNNQDRSPSPVTAPKKRKIEKNRPDEVEEMEQDDPVDVPPRAPKRRAATSSSQGPSTSSAGPSASSPPLTRSQTRS